MSLVNSFSLNKWRTRWLGLASLTVILAVSGCGKSTAVNSSIALGEVMGKQTAMLLGDHGNVVLLISEPDNAKSEGLEQTMAAFKQALGKTVKVSAVENLQLHPLPGLPLFSSQNFSDVLQKYATADAVVSFVMLPMLTPDEVRRMPSPRPKVVAMVGGPLKNLFTQGVVSLAAQPKPDPNTATKPGTAQECFDANFQLVTLDNAGTVLN